MAKNERLAANVVTPTTKADTHDVPIAPEGIVDQGLMSQVGVCVSGGNKNAARSSIHPHQWPVC